LGGRRSLPTYLDATALEHDTIHVSAGRRGLEIELAPRDLAALTAAEIRPIAR
jgi:Cys-tRNA(Pro)/Cys-tRNA(Cys) deacylase